MGVGASLTLLSLFSFLLKTGNPPKNRNHRNIIDSRIKGTLVSEPRFSTPGTCDFSHAIQGKGKFFKEKPSKKAISLVSHGKNHMSHGVETLRAQRLKKLKILKFSSEIDIFRQATHQTPFFVWGGGGSLKVRIEIFKQD